jgi:RNA polymerase sigma factor (sigma-70 family)
MEASALTHTPRAPALAGRSPLLRLQGDEKLIALIRRGHQGAFETLVQRYQTRLLAFCRHMLGSTEDAEDVLQEVFASAYRAINADERPINARPWLYRIARNRCLNHLRRPVPTGQDSMDMFERDGGATTADTVHKREEFRLIVADVQDLPETQRTALLLREMDALSYEQIAEAMDNTVPSVKSLLVRARVSLAEAAEARLLTCAEVRIELGEVAEGLIKSTPQARRHLRSCDRCRRFKGELRRTGRALAAIYPIGPLVILQKLLLAKLGVTAWAGGGAATGGSGAAGLGGAGAAGAGLGAGGAAGGAGLATGGAGAGIATAGSAGRRAPASWPRAPEQREQRARASRRARVPERPPRVPELRPARAPERPVERSAPESARWRRRPRRASWPPRS